MKVPALILTIFMSAAVAAGQETTISCQTLEKNTDSAILKAINYSRSVRTERKVASERSEEIFEAQLPGRFRTSHRTTRNGKTTAIESIMIDSVMYKRENEGAWKRLAMPELSVRDIALIAPGSNCTSQILILDGKRVTLYKAVHRFGRFGEDKRYDYESVNSFWIDESRKIIRIVQDVRDLFGTTYTESTYVYGIVGPKIEAPIK